MLPTYQRGLVRKALALLLSADLRAGPGSRASPETMAMKDTLWSGLTWLLWAELTGLCGGSAIWGGRNQSPVVDGADGRRGPGHPITWLSGLLAALPEADISSGRPSAGTTPCLEPGDTKLSPGLHNALSFPFQDLKSGPWVMGQEGEGLSNEGSLTGSCSVCEEPAPLIMNQLPCRHHPYHPGLKGGQSSLCHCVGQRWN